MSGSDLADWLDARITEDEEVARACAETDSPTWSPVDNGPYAEVDGLYLGGWPSQDYSHVNHEAAEHIARWDPARVLAECAAKRRIVEQCSLALAHVGLLPLRTGSGKSGEYAVASLTLLLLAMPYAGHPEFREEWRMPGR